MARVVHFEIPTDKPEESINFYSKVFGWKMTKFGNFDYWLAGTGDEKEPGINGAIMKKNHPGQPVTNSIKVEDIDVSIKDIEVAGGKIVVPKTPIPSIGYFAYFTDLDGNIMGVMQDDKNAQ